MMSNNELTEIVSLFGLSTNGCEIKIISNGLINRTWKITTETGDFILQQINTNVFTHPDLIAENVGKIKSYLSQHQPGYLFVAPLSASNGKTFIKDNQDHYFRLFPFVQNSHTVNAVSSPQQAFEAAKQFGKFTRVLAHFNASQLNITLPHFHDLLLRFQQFEQAVKMADAATLAKARPFIEDIYKQQAIVTKYKAIVTDEIIPFRVCHHDTKISNVLFDKNDKGLCVIDLDTVMPGYIISDVGDMLRTYLSPASEEEQDMGKIKVRKDFFAAIIQGYLSEMNELLTKDEKDLLIYAGKFMMYMQAIRFLTDFLNKNVYYQITYPLQNLYRAQNQLTLLQRFAEAEPELMNLL